MKIADHLSKEQKQKLSQIHTPKNKQKNKDTRDKEMGIQKKPEQLSRNDWLNIMGVHRDVYTRVNGSVRRK